MLAAPITSIFLSLQTPGYPSPAMTRIEVVDSEAVITGYTHAGEVDSTISYWLDNGVAHILAEFSDGGFAAVIVDGDDLDIESNLSLRELAARTRQLKSALQLTPHPDIQAGWFACAGGILATVYGAATASPLTPLAGALAMCACAPILFKGSPEGEQECP